MSLVYKIRGFVKRGLKGIEIERVESTSYYGVETKSEGVAHIKMQFGPQLVIDICFDSFGSWDPSFI